jgi:glycosyltransferase involved in cell wall biosynthesis
MASSSKEQIKIFCIAHENTGVGFYRVIQPLKYMAKKKLAKIRSTYFDGKLKPQNVPQEVWEEHGKWCNIFYTTAAKTRSQCAYMMAVRDAYKIKLVVDIDDHVTALNPDHPNYRNFQEGNVSIWAQKSLEHADLCVTTNEYLSKQYASVNKEWFVSPNSIDLDLWELSPKEYKKDHHVGVVRIGWVGASAHEKDLKLLQKPIEVLRKKYGKKIEIVTLGQKHRNIKEDKHLGFYDIDSYPKAYFKANFDIILAPMTDTAYNRGKSNLRLIEASTQKLPIVASPVGEYRGYPCLYAKEREEWVEQISKLVDSPEERAKVGQACYDELKKDYTVDAVVPKLYERLKKLKSKRWRKK